MPANRNSIATLSLILNWFKFLTDLSLAVLSKEHKFSKWAIETRNVLEKTFNKLCLKSISPINIDEIVADLFTNFTQKYSAIPNHTPELQLLNKICVFFDSLIIDEGCNETTLNVKDHSRAMLDNLYADLVKPLTGQESLSLVEMKARYAIANNLYLFAKDKEALTLLEDIFAKLIDRPIDSGDEESMLFLIEVELKLGEIQINLNRFTEAMQTLKNNLKREEDYFKENPHPLTSGTLSHLGRAMMKSPSGMNDAEIFLKRALQVEVAVCLNKAETNRPHIKVPAGKLACALAFEGLTGVSLADSALSSPALINILLTMATLNRDKPEEGSLFLQAAKYIAKRDAEMHLVSPLQFARVYAVAAEFNPNPEGQIHNLEKAIELIGKIEEDGDSLLLAYLLIQLSVVYGFARVTKKNPQHFQYVEDLLERGLSLCDAPQLLILYDLCTSVRRTGAKAPYQRLVLLFTEYFLKFLTEEKIVVQLTDAQKQQVMTDINSLRSLYDKCKLLYTAKLHKEFLKQKGLQGEQKITVKDLILSRKQEQVLNAAIKAILEWEIGERDENLIRQKADFFITERDAIAAGKKLGPEALLKAIDLLRPYLNLNIDSSPNPPLLEEIAETAAIIHYGLGYIYCERLEWSLAMEHMQLSLNYTIEERQSTIHYEESQLKLALCREKLAEMPETPEHSVSHDTASAVSKGEHNVFKPAQSVFYFSCFVNLWAPMICDLLKKPSVLVAKNHYDLSEAYAKQSNWSEAIEHLEMAIKVYSDITIDIPSMNDAEDKLQEYREKTRDTQQIDEELVSPSNQYGPD